MPTVLEGLVDDLGGTDLDEKARAVLLEGANGVHVLSILHRMGGHRDQVRNPSAFVEKAIRNIAGAAAGPQELENALQRLVQSGLIDDNATSALKNGSVEDACAAISALLTQEAGAVRNTAAYVTRNMANARNKGTSGAVAAGAAGALLGGCVGAMQGDAIGTPTAAAQMAFASQQAYGMAAAGYATALDPLARWSGLLDQKAIDALASVGGIAAAEILQEMETKGGSVRNPSAYVQRACENRIKDATAAGGSSAIAGTAASQLAAAGYVGVAAAQPAGYQGLLDQDALDALTKVRPEEAQQILTNLENRASSVRNPSAYVVRSVANMIGEGGAAQQQQQQQQQQLQQQQAMVGGAAASFQPTSYALDAAALMYGQQMGVVGQAAIPQGYAATAAGYAAMAGYPGVCGGGAFAAAVPQEATGGTLDEKAIQTLRDLPPEVADAILAELQQKGSAVHNPSAYVQRAAANARRGEGAAATVAAQVPGGLEAMQRQAAAEAAAGGSMSDQLDERARSALAELTPEAAQAIIQVLDEQGGKVQNPSAYVLKAVGNARKGQGAGGTAQRLGGSQAQSDAYAAELEALLAPWRPRLDAEAQKALEVAGYQAARHILGELEAKGGTVRNPSAYVAKAVANFKNGIAPAGPGTGAPGAPGGALSAASLGRQPAMASVAGGGSRWDVGDDGTQQAAAELAEELPRVLGGLDEKAMVALDEVGVHAALSIVRLLNSQGGKVNNPNAYVMRACANEKRAGTGGLPSAKRARMD